MSDPLNERRLGLVRALDETVNERRDQTIVSRVEKHIEDSFQAFLRQPATNPGTVAVRLVGYDETEDCAPANRLPLSGVTVRLTYGKEQTVSSTTGAAGLAVFDLADAVDSAYNLEVASDDGNVITQVEGDYQAEVGVARLLEIGRSQALEPAFARGRNLILAADRARTKVKGIGTKIERALTRQEDALRDEIAALDAMIALPESQG